MLCRTEKKGNCCQKLNRNKIKMFTAGGGVMITDVSTSFAR